MDSDEQTHLRIAAPRSETPLEPAVIAAGAFFVGWAVGSGRVVWLQHEVKLLSQSVASWVIELAQEAFEEKNPGLHRTSG